MFTFAGNANPLNTTNGITPALTTTDKYFSKVSVNLKIYHSKNNYVWQDLKQTSIKYSTHLEQFPVAENDN